MFFGSVVRGHWSPIYDSLTLKPSHTPNTDPNANPTYSINPNANQ